ncbi:MAG: hypothetical protein IJR15_08315 [Clostridiales bacterium]|nr:hypothetical protein [Clostridiales bacterium]
MSPKSLKLYKEKIWTGLAGVFAAMLAALVCFFLKDEVLGCHDSFYDFIFARMHTFKEWYDHVLEFNLARGRVGYLSALVITFRYYVLSTGNFTAIWLLQQIPIWFTVGLIAFVTGKKTRPVYGLMFVTFYAVFCQIDTNHNLMNCYPFDFMYGMSLMVLGLFLYDCWLSNLGKKRAVIYIILSVFCYYESMTVYEPFITACFIYALISFAHVWKHRKELGKKSFLKFFVRLIPHAVTAVVFFGILQYIKMNPIVQSVEVTAVDEYGDFNDFINTWSTFSLSLFPLSNCDHVNVVTSFQTLLQGMFLPVFSGCAAAAVICSFLASRYMRVSPTRRRDISFNLLILSLSGLLFAVFFTLPHSMTANYQMWVRDLNAKGYLTSSLCYFGWALMFSCLISILINVLSYRRKAALISSMLVTAFLFFTAAEVTMNINMDFRDDDAVTGQQMSYRAQAFYSFFSSEYANKYAAILIYVPGLSGVHFNMDIDDGYADFESGRELTLTNSLREFRRESVYYDYCGVFQYLPSADAAWYTSIENPAEPPSEWVSNGNLVMISTYPSVYDITYTEHESGQTVTQAVDMGRMELYVIGDNQPADADSLAVTVR